MKTIMMIFILLFTCVSNLTSQKYNHLQETNIGGIHFVYLKGGEYLMGAVDLDKKAFPKEKPRHKVYVSGFWISKYEVTQKQYQIVTGTNPSYYKLEWCPVDSVSWNDSMEFCRIFSKMHGIKVRLPYEAEWEYACRAGTETIYYWGDDFDDNYCWHNDNSMFKTHIVGLKKPKKWG